MGNSIKLPELEKRFTEPKGWRWHNFTRETKRGDRKIRFGSVFPTDSVPDAVIVCLQGVREFSEKYFEIAHWCLENNFAFWIMDWHGQGKSTRYLENSQKRHNHHFDEDVADLHYFILQYIKHSSVHPDKGRIPLAMLGHSMGANIGMRFLAKHQGMFECAAFTSPMIGIKVFEYIPQYLALTATALTSTIIGKSYVPGGNDWGQREEHARLSSDSCRKDVDRLWCMTDEELQCGDVTLGWLHNAQKSCMQLQKPSVTSAIKTHCLFGIPGYEDLVDNARAHKAISHMQNAKTIEYPEAYHEILMDKSEFRDDFLNHFYTLIKENIIDRPETLKPF